MTDPSHTAAWQELEATVERTASRLRELKDENAALRRRAAELEARLAAEGDETQERWREEREEVARRVDGLVERLESILETAARD